MLLGAIDDAAGVIYVDRVTGPPPDSFLSATYFRHGQAEHPRGGRRPSGRLACDDRVRRVLAHPPGGSRRAKPDRQEGMASIVTPDGRRQRALMIIMAGPRGQWDRWMIGKEAHPAVFARAGAPRRRDSRSAARRLSADATLPAGPFFRGGFSQPAPAGITRWLAGMLARLKLDEMALEPAHTFLLGGAQRSQAAILGYPLGWGEPECLKTRRRQQINEQDRRQLAILVLQGDSGAVELDDRIDVLTQ